jgi:hypothetical protein
VPLRRLALVAALALVAVPAAHADADPASDILYTQRIYLPFFGQKVAPTHARALKQTVDAAWKKGYKVKVALIATKNDLGGIFQLWQKPQTYADFLGRELVFLYKGLLVTVMPDGMGVYRFKHSVASEQAAIEGITVQPGADGLADSANIAVAKLAGLPPPKLPSGGGGGSKGSGTPAWMLAVIIAGGLAILTAMLVLGPMAYRRRRAA